MPAAAASPAAASPLGFGLQTVGKDLPDLYAFASAIPGGHSSRPRPDNAIYELADALKALQAHRFTPTLNETTRAYFTERAKQEGDSALGKAMRAWLANPNDGAAADAIEANELEVGLTRTRCVATKLKGGHADNALPQLAEATVNCRILPGVEPKIVQAELQVGGRRQGDDRPRRRCRAADAGVAAAQGRRRRLHQGGSRALPGAADHPANVDRRDRRPSFRARGIPVYGVDGAWGVSPDDERAHGKDERLPVQAL